MDSSDWDDRYRSTELVWGSGPNLFLEPEVAGLTPGSALDLACGEGRNAVWLAEQGWSVTGVDFSAVALDKARALADRRGAQVQWVRADVTAWEGRSESTDLVIVFYLQLPDGARRKALVSALRILKPGGVLLVVGHDEANLADGVGGPPDPTVLYNPGDVLSDLDSAGAAYEVERADTVERPVEGADRPALDCLVRVRRQA